MFKLVAIIFGCSALLAAFVRFVLLGANPIVAGLALVINAVVLYFYFQRAHVARWIICFGGLWGAISGTITFFGLDGDPVGKLSFAGLLLMVFIAADLFVCGVGLFSEEVNKEFDT